MTAQAFGPDMVAAGSGAIVVTGNSGACRGTACFVGFAPTKAFQRILGESLARVLGPQGVQSCSRQRYAVSTCLREGIGLHICDGTKQIRKIIIYRRKLAKVQIRA